MNADLNSVKRRRHELNGVLLSFLALFLGLSFLSHSPLDSCIFIRQGLESRLSNWMGPVGANLSGWLFTLLGFSTWLIALAVGAIAYWSFRGRLISSPQKIKHLILRSAGALILLFVTAIFLHLAFGQARLDGLNVAAGGVLGTWLGDFISSVLGKAGALFLITLLTLLALMAAVDFSPVEGARATLDGAAWLREKVGVALTRWREARRRRKDVDKERLELAKLRTQPEIKIVVDAPSRPLPKVAPPVKPKQEKLPFIKEGSYELPSTELMDETSASQKKLDREGLLMNAQILENKLRDFGVQGEVVEVHPGPVITMYEYRPGSGVKINKITGLADDLAMALSAISVRIIAPIPGKDVVGIEISNVERESVGLREIIECEAFSKIKSPMPMALGKGITGEPFIFDLRKAPHLLVAGSTGSGKSVSLNAMIMGVLYRATPREVRMLMIDPKRLELSIYEGVPHLLHPVIANPKDAALSLKWAVSEMERRYTLLAAQGVRHIDSYNRLAAKNSGKGKKKKAPEPESSQGDTIPIVERTLLSAARGANTAEKSEPAARPEPPDEPMPLILVIIDELADLMMVAARDIEESICRLAQMARAAGIHLILATQRPSVDVITGLIKANFPSRIGFKVASKTDSRTILDQNGSERLLGQGDMLFLAPGTSNLVRLHGAFVSDQEIKRVTEFWREQGEPEYAEEILRPQPGDKAEEVEAADEKYEEALRIVVSTRQASISMLQRKLKIGYNRAARIIERMEMDGYVGPSDGVKSREVLIDPLQLEQMTG